MQCSLFQSLLDQAVESHADSVSAEVRAHGTTCSNPACCQEWAEYSLLTRALAEWQSGLPQIDLSDRVLAELFPVAPSVASSEATAAAPALRAYVEQSWRDFRSPSQRPWAIALSVVGVMLVIGTLIVSIPPSPTAEVVIRPRNNPVLAPPREQWATRTPSSSNVAVQSVEWAQKASSVMAQTIVSIPERGAEWVPGDSWGTDWQLKLEPIRRDAHAAWDALLNELPLPNQPAS
jgi:hypothetical protein